MKRQALILAAGRGSRLGELTANSPKCMLQVQGKTLLDHIIEKLKENEVEKPVVVTGYQASALNDRIGAKLVFNDQWHSTNMLESLRLGLQAIDSSGPLLISYSDILYEPELMGHIFDSTQTHGFVLPSYTFAKDLWRLRFSEPLADIESFRVRKDRTLVEIGGRPPNLELVQGQFAGLLGISAERVSVFQSQLLRYLESHGHQQSTTDFLQWTTLQNEFRWQVLDFTGLWYEFDTEQDVQLYPQWRAKLGL
jgi:choline kinase